MKAQSFIVTKPAQGTRQSVRPSRLDAKTVTVIHQFRIAANRCRYDRNPVGHVLKNSIGKAFPIGTKHPYIESVQVAVHIPDVPGKLYDRTESEPVRQIEKRLPLGSISANNGT